MLYIVIILLIGVPTMIAEVALASAASVVSWRPSAVFQEAAGGRSLALSA